MRVRLRAWLEPKVRRQRARAVAAEAAVADTATDPVAEIEQMMDDIIAAHNERYHPGFSCAENTLGQCWDRFGGERAAGPLGEYGRLP